jgi:predicted RNA-binding Zn ribbon-like protein
MDIPEQGALVLRFANTLDLDEGTDELDSPARSGEWLITAGLLDRDPGVTPHEHALALALRAGVREAAGAAGGAVPDPRVLEAANAALRELPLQVTIGIPAEGDVRHTAPLTAAAGGTGGSAPVLQALGGIAAAWAELAITGGSARLKRCPEQSCAWLFWDATKNGSRKWCSMRVCGNRAKTAAYAARQRGR